MFRNIVLQDKNIIGKKAYLKFIKMTFDWYRFSCIVSCAIRRTDTISRGLAQNLWIVNCRLILYNGFIVWQSLSYLSLVTSRAHLVIIPIIWVASTVVCIRDGNDLISGVASICQTELVPGTWLSWRKDVVRIICSQMGIGMRAMCRWDNSLRWI